MRRRRFVALAAGAGSAAVAGCGDASDDPGSQSTDRAEGRQQMGGQENASAGENGTATEPSTAEETATGEESPTDTEPAETATETSAETEATDAGSGAERRSVEYPEESVDVRDVEYDANHEADAGPTVTGVVENVSGETLRYVEAKVVAYDGDDEQLGDALADATDLPDGETWAFECELWDTDAENVAYWTCEIAVSRQYDESSPTPGSA